MSRTALDGYPFGDLEKEEFVKVVKRFSRVYFVEVLAYTVLSNHWHIVLRMFPDSYFSDDDIKERYFSVYGKEAKLAEEDIPYFRKKWSSLSKYVQEIKQTFSRYYNKHHNRQGTLWGERFKSTIVEDGETLVNCMAYVELNPVRAGLSEKPEDYRWCSLAYHVQTGNKDNFLSLDFGQVEFGVDDPAERFRRYRRYVYESGALNKKGQTSSKKIDERIVERERKRKYEISRVDRFRYRTRYFTDSGILGSKEFVSRHYHMFKERFQSKNEKQPKAVKGLDGIFSLKRLTES